MTRKRFEREWARIYGRVQELFPDAPPVTAEVTPKVREKPRHFADVELSHPVRLRLHPEIIHGKVSRIRGVLAHEAGHIVDLGLLSDGGFHRICSDMGYSYTNDEELRADILAEWLTGWTIYYDGDHVQCAGPGSRGTTPRPPRLR